MSKLVLIVDDDPVQRRLLDAQLSRLGLKVRTCSGGREAIDLLAGAGAGGGDVSAVVLDLMMPDRSGSDVLAEMQRRGLEIPVIVQTAKGSIDTAVEAMRAGAFDFVVKPVSPEKMKASIETALKVGATRSRQSRWSATRPVLSAASAEASPAFAPVLAGAARAARSQIPILLTGETGSGKEWLARLIQAESPRRDAPFVTVNCGALPGDLVESLLFGHAKGAFTDAATAHAGKFAEADGGTLFLDEIGELPPLAQVKLLRVLQDGMIEPLGGRGSVRTDVRIVSATNRDLAADVRDGRFREDLYYRLNAFELRVPPLRERREEIPGLARGLLARLKALEASSRVERLSEDAIDLLCRFDWPGNVRQLENVLHRAVVLGENAALGVPDLPQIAGLLRESDPKDERLERPVVERRSSRRLPDDTAARAAPDLRKDQPRAERRSNPDRRRPALGASANGVAASFRLRDEDGEIRSMDAIEADVIRLAVGQYGGHMSEIARRLGIGRSTLYRKMREYDIGAK